MTNLTLVHSEQLEFIDGVLDLKDDSTATEFIKESQVVNVLKTKETIKSLNVIEQAIYDIDNIQEQLVMLTSESNLHEQNIKELTEVVKELANPYYNEANIKLGPLCSRQGIY